VVCCVRIVIGKKCSKSQDIFRQKTMILFAAYKLVCFAWSGYCVFSVSIQVSDVVRCQTAPTPITPLTVERTGHKNFQVRVMTSDSTYPRGRNRISSLFSTSSTTGAKKLSDADFAPGTIKNMELSNPPWIANSWLHYEPWKTAASAPTPRHQYRMKLNAW
jgi:hypothetical protein